MKLAVMKRGEWIFIHSRFNPTLLTDIEHFYLKTIDLYSFRFQSLFPAIHKNISKQGKTTERLLKLKLKKKVYDGEIEEKHWIM